MVEVKPLLAHEWPLLKQVRLRALADAPDAFSTTLAQAQTWTDGDWQKRAGRFAVNPPAAARIAYLEGAPCGMMTCYPAAPQPDVTGPIAELTSVWLAPAARGQGAGEALVASIVDWANAQGIGVLQAWVMEGNEGAIAFYKKVGFAQTAQRQPDEPDPSKHIILLTRRLQPPSSHLASSD